LQDAIHGKVNNKNVNIFGYNIDPLKTPPLDFQQTRLLIANSSDANLRKKIPNCLEFLHQVENILKMKKTVAQECLEPPAKYAKSGVWLLSGSKRWLRSSPMISLYALLIRVGFVHKKGNSYQQTILDILSGVKKTYSRNDKSYLNNSMNAIKKILNFGDRKIFYPNIKNNYPQNIPVSMMHNCGIVAYARGTYTKKNFPRWHRFDGEELKLCLPLVQTQNSC
jgi:hypothetical protein